MIKSIMNLPFSKNVGIILIVISLLLIIILFLAKQEIDEQGVFLCEAVSNSPALKMEDCPVHTGNLQSLLIVAFGVAFVTLASGVYIFLTAGKKSINLAEKESTLEIDLSKLDSEEQKIYGLIKEKDGSMYQSDLIKETGFSKVYITRILDKMEGKKVLERKRRGMTNIIVLK